MQDNANKMALGRRIHDIRMQLGVSMDEFAKMVDGTTGKAKSGTVANWETGKNAPNKKRLKAIATLGNISLNYLVTGNPKDDDEGWKLWTMNTGYSQSEIENEIAKLTASNRFEPTTPLQAKISLAVSALSGFGAATDYGAVLSIDRSLAEVYDLIDTYYQDPKKIKKNTQKLGESPVFSSNQLNDGSLIFDDMNNEVYLELKQIIFHSREQTKSLIGRL